MTPQLTKLTAWQALEAHYPKVRELHLRKLFADDPKRGERMSIWLSSVNNFSFLRQASSFVKAVSTATHHYRPLG